MKAALLVGLLLSACAPTVADKGRAIAGAVTVARGGCVALLLDATIPRSPETQARCDALLQGAP